MLEAAAHANTHNASLDLESQSASAAWRRTIISDGADDQAVACHSVQGRAAPATTERDFGVCARGGTAEASPAPMTVSLGTTSGDRSGTSQGESGRLEGDGGSIGEDGE